MIFTLSVKSQSIENKRPVYCDMMAYSFWGIGKIRIILDMGDRKAGQEFETICENNGKQKKFNTMMEALNYMGERGWKVIGTYYLESFKTPVIHYLLEKWISDESERKAGLILEEEKKREVIEDDSYYVPKKKDKEKQAE